MEFTRAWNCCCDAVYTAFPIDFSLGNEEKKRVDEGLKSSTGQDRMRSPPDAPREKIVRENCGRSSKKFLQAVDDW